MLAQRRWYCEVARDYRANAEGRVFGFWQRLCIVCIYSDDPASARAAMVLVQRSAGVVYAQKYYRAVVTGVKDFGAFAKINAVNEGLIPVEELYERGSPRDGDEDGSGGGGGDKVVEGTKVVVKVLGTDARGHLRLSRKRALGVDDALIEY